jgi:hypothetical protein
MGVDDVLSKLLAACFFLLVGLVVLVCIVFVVVFAFFAAKEQFWPHPSGVVPYQVCDSVVMNPDGLVRDVPKLENCYLAYRACYVNGSCEVRRW